VSLLLIDIRRYYIVEIDRMVRMLLMLLYDDVFSVHNDDNDYDWEELWLFVRFYRNDSQLDR